jgi:uncharacterized damage-inducible protein DinB
VACPPPWPPRGNLGDIDQTGVGRFYEGWQLTNERLVATIGALSLEQLKLKPAPHLWPIWATTAHLAGARVYWLCGVFKEPGAESTPFIDPNGDGWEDDPGHPRHAKELVFALESSWAIVRQCLERWTPETLDSEARRLRDDKIQVHTRQSVLMRLLTHDASHAGEISQTLGMYELPELDLWTGRAPTVSE